MIKPTGRAVVLFWLSLPFALFTVIANPGNWVVCIYVVGAAMLAILADAAMAFSPRSLNIKATTADKIYIGEHSTVSIVVEQPRARANVRFEMILEQRGDVDPPQPATVQMRGGTETKLDFTVVPRRRGRIWIDRVWVRWRGPMQLVEFTKTVELNRVIEVVPNVRGVHKAALQFTADDTIFGEKIQHKGEGIEFEALREYRPGHDIRFIDWKHSARHRKLLSKEFRTERNHNVIMAFDTGHLMVEPLGGIPRLDHTINAALRLAWLSLHSGDLVGTFGFDSYVRQYVQPVRGPTSFGRIQRATAELDYHYQETNFTLGLAELNARLKRRALVILFTDFVDTVTAELLIESMQRMAKRHVVVFVTLRDSFLQQTVDHQPEQFQDVARAVIAQDFLHERSIVLERLARCGVHCLDVPSGNLPVTLINRYLQIKQRGLI